MRFMRLAVFLLGAGLGVTAFALNAPAASIEFIHTGTGSGTIGTTAFTGAPFTITEFADTTNRASSSEGFFVDDTSASISIGTLGTFGFTTGTRTFVNNNFSIIGFSREGIFGADLYNGPTNAAFAAYDLLTSIGPIGGTALLLQWTVSPVDTTGGILTFASATTDGTFRAITGAVVPEPGTFLLLASGLAGLAGSTAWRKRSHR
jgi:hypothetical protein